MKIKRFVSALFPPLLQKRSSTALCSFYDMATGKVKSVPTKLSRLGSDVAHGWGNAFTPIAKTCFASSLNLVTLLKQKNPWMD